MTRSIGGTWCEFQHHNKAEGVHWNPACAGFTPEDWDAKMAEMAAMGLEYLVLMAVALDHKAFYPTTLLPPWKLATPDPLDSLMTAADRHGMKVFVGNGFWGTWDSPDIIADPQARRRRLQAMEELAAQYGQHPSFYGWYWPNEAEIQGHFRPVFIDYVRECNQLARQLLPAALTLIAPYGTNQVQADDDYARQLEALDVDVVAYQDEVGVRKSGVEETGAYYEALRKVHDKVARARLWADVEVFEFAAEVYRSALLPARFERVRRQLEAVSPFVETILIYQYQGMMNQPDSAAFAGHPDSTRLYSDYVAWLRRIR